jgi:hypothetical protein
MHYYNNKLLSVSIPLPRVRCARACVLRSRVIDSVQYVCLKIIITESIRDTSRAVFLFFNNVIIIYRFTVFRCRSCLKIRRHHRRRSSIIATSTIGTHVSFVIANPPHFCADIGVPSQDLHCRFPTLRHVLSLDF